MSECELYGSLRKSSSDKPSSGGMFNKMTLKCQIIISLILHKVHKSC